MALCGIARICRRFISRSAARSDWRRDYAAAGRVEQAEAEGGDRPAVGSAFEVFALVVLDRAVEIEAEVGAAIERVGRHVLVGLRRVQLGDAG